MTFQTQVRRLSELRPLIDECVRVGDTQSAAYYHRVLATANGRYDFQYATLNDALERGGHVEFRPVTFEQWLHGVYQTP